MIDTSTNPVCMHCGEPIPAHAECEEHGVTVLVVKCPKCHLLTPFRLDPQYSKKQLADRARREAEQKQPGLF